MNGCPVLNELAVTEDYDREHENAPVLSGGDYDIGGIRSSAEECALAAANLALSRSRDEWREQATKNAARIEELATVLNRLITESVWTSNALFNVGQGHEQWASISEGLDRLACVMMEAGKALNLQGVRP